MIEYQFIPDVEGDKNRGWQVDMFQAVENNLAVGYLKVAFIPKERREKHYPAPFELYYFADRINGWCGLSAPCILNDPLKLAHELYRRVQDYYDSSYYKTIETASVGELTTKLLPDLNQKLEKCLRRSWQAFCLFHEDPYVDYIQVCRSHQRQGIATNLYLLAGTQYSKGLRSSGLQTDEAKACWKNLSAKGLTTERKVPLYTGKGIQRFKYETRLVVSSKTAPSNLPSYQTVTAPLPFKGNTLN
jgi:hypothetical protein